MEKCFKSNLEKISYAIISYYSWLAEKSGVEIPDWSDEKFKRIVLSYTEDGIVDVISKGSHVTASHE